MNKKLLTASLLLPFLCNSAYSIADDNFERRIIATNGYGEVKAHADIAKLNLSVKVTRKAALDAKSEADNRVNQFIAELAKQGVAKQDIIASSLRTAPRYEYNKLSSRQQFAGYDATRTLQVTVRDLNKLTALMDAALQQDIQGINRIAYESSQADQHRQAARSSAIDDSKQKAQSLAAAYGAELGNIVRITYQSSNPSPRPTFRESGRPHLMAASDNQATGVYLADKVIFSDNIQVIFDLIIEN